MKTNFFDFILEKSSLTKFGVPKYVMKSIQEDFAINSEAEWEKYNNKQDILTDLKNNKSLFIQITTNEIDVFGNDVKKDNYFIDKYIYEDDGWGGDFKKLEREFKTLTQLSIDIRSKVNIYKLLDKFSLKNKDERDLNKEHDKHIDFVEQFKTDFIKNYDNILRNITNKNFNSANEKIKEKAKLIAYQNDIIIKNLDNPLKGQNGLSILDEFLYKFEDEYASYFKERLDVQELSEYFTRDKVLTMFMYFIYTGKLMK